MNVIVAVDENWGIGYKGTQPFVIPEDRKHFREITSGCTVIVGRKTLLDFPGGKPLPKRRNIVLTTDEKLIIDGAETAGSVDAVFSMVKDEKSEKVFVIGGESVYKKFLPYCRYAYITKIYAQPDADRFFENLDELENWKIDDIGPLHEYDGVKYQFIRYENIKRA